MDQQTLERLEVLVFSEEPFSSSSALSGGRGSSRSWL
jgi:hypothetical protein